MGIGTVVMAVGSKCNGVRTPVCAGGGADADEEAARGEAAQAAQRITLWAREVKGEGAHVKQWRVILRNLPFQVSTCACL